MEIQIGGPPQAVTVCTILPTPHRAVRPSDSPESSLTPRLFVTSPSDQSLAIATERALEGAAG